MDIELKNGFGVVLLTSLVFSLEPIGAVSAQGFRLYDPAVESFDFAAPVVSSESDVTDKKVGMIIFDASANQFKGLNVNGDWTSMTPPSGGYISSDGSSQRVERAEIAAGSPCSSSPCTVSYESGDWLDYVERTGAGQYVLHFNAGIFWHRLLVL